jgi:hypothetical protein
MSGSGGRARWIARHRETIPSLGALTGVAMFWSVGLVGGISYLHGASSPMAMLGGLYIMLAAVALSIVVTTAALSRLAHHFSRQRLG